MTGHDSSDDMSPENIAMLALAAFSTSYNLPVYLRYNNTFRRAYLRMFRCRCGSGRDTAELVTNTRPATVIPGSRSTYEQRGTCRQVTFGREPQGHNEPQPSTSHDCRSTRAVSRPPAVFWASHPYTEQLEASNSHVFVQRY